jgi:hypothetical protein
MDAAKRQEEMLEEEARKRQEAQFPVSIEDFHGKPKDVQHRAARFLVLEEGTKQEKMLSEYGWAWRQVKPLQEEMTKNVKCFFFLVGWLRPLTCVLMNRPSSRLTYRRSSLNST